MPSRPLLALVWSAAAALTAGGPSARAAEPDEILARMTTVSLDVEGEVKATPDLASIAFGVQTRSPSAAQAIKDNRARMSSVLTLLKAAGVETKDVQTSSLTLNQQYTYAPNQPPKLANYQATNQVRIQVRDLAKLGADIDAVSAAGVTEIGGITFSLAHSDTLQDEARKQAIRRAAERAALYAEATGLKLGRLITISEGSGGPIPVAVSTYANAMRDKVNEAPTPVEPGEITVSVQVHAIYELVK